MSEAGRCEIEAIEVDLLLEALYRCHGYDFRGYGLASLTRRIRWAVKLESAATVSQLIERVLRDPECAARVVGAMSVNTTAMFRDPKLYRMLRAEVVPILRTYPVIRVWHAGCATGEEVFSMAILLHEEGLLPRTRIYATDIAEDLIERAASGTVSLRRIDESATNYRRAGGRRDFSHYYEADGHVARFSRRLRERVLFSTHNLATDAAFNQFNLIMCRNVMIYFAGPLRDRAHALLYDSLARFGYLCLGDRESLATSELAPRYRGVVAGQRIYRRVA